MKHLKLFEEIENFSGTYEASLKMRILRETQSGELKWIIVDLKNKDWFKSITHLKEPQDAYLEIHVLRPVNDWELYIYYFRKDKNGIISEDGIEIKKIIDNNIKTISEKIKEKLEIV